MKRVSSSKQVVEGSKFGNFEPVRKILLGKLQTRLNLVKENMKKSEGKLMLSEDIKVVDSDPREIKTCRVWNVTFTAESLDKASYLIRWISSNDIQAQLLQNDLVANTFRVKPVSTEPGVFTVVIPFIQLFGGSISSNDMIKRVANALHFAYDLLEQVNPTLKGVVLENVYVAQPNEKIEAWSGRIEVSDESELKQVKSALAKAQADSRVLGYVQSGYLDVHVVFPFPHSNPKSAQDQLRRILGTNGIRSEIIVESIGDQQLQVKPLSEQVKVEVSPRGKATGGIYKGHPVLQYQATITFANPANTGKAYKLMTGREETNSVRVLSDYGIVITWFSNGTARNVSQEINSVLEKAGLLNEGFALAGQFVDLVNVDVGIPKRIKTQSGKTEVLAFPICLSFDSDDSEGLVKKAYEILKSRDEVTQMDYRNSLTLVFYWNSTGSAWQVKQQIKKLVDWA